MKKLLTLLLLVVTPLMGVSELKLADGVTIRGPIIRESASHYVIDLGFKLLSIPTAQVVKRIDLKKESAPAQEIGTFFYQRTDLKNRDIAIRVPQLAPAVVVVNTPSGLGSGFLINAQGYLITNFHVIQGEKNIKITMFEKRKNGFEKVVYEKVKIIAYNPFQDLALLKIETPQKKFPFVYLGNIDQLSNGDDVFAIGTPLGMERSTSSGIVSSKMRNYNGQLYIQTTAPINPGNSGGPLFNKKGEVVGVTNMGYLFSDGLGFAIPINVVKAFIKNKEAFFYNEHNPNTGHHYLKPPKGGKK